MFAVDHDPVNAGRPRQGPRHIRAGETLPQTHTRPFALVESRLQFTSWEHFLGGICSRMSLLDPVL